MNTAMSTKRVFVATEAAPRSFSLQDSAYVFLAGIACMIAALFVGSAFVMTIGFLGTAIGGHILNSAFWANYFEKYPEQMPKVNDFVKYE